MMKAYKATYNGKCKDITYEVEKTYTFKGKLKLCSRGFHYCENFEDLTHYYKFVKNEKYNDEIKVFEIEVLGNVIQSSNKCVSDKIKILRELNKEEILKGIEKIYKFNENDIIFFVNWEYKYDDKNNLVKIKDYGRLMREYKYDKNNNLIENKHHSHRTHHSGLIVEYEYDDQNNLIFENDGVRKYIFYEYDNRGNLIYKKYSDKNVWEYKYDEKNNLIWEKFINGNFGGIFNILEYKYSDSKIIKKRKNKIIEKITIS